jgi:hypothetical protein
MGGKQKAKAQERANQLAAKNARMAQRTAKRERRLAKRLSRQDRRAAQERNEKLIEAERNSAAELAKLQGAQNIQTEFVDDREARRRKLLARQGRSAYGFARGSGAGLGGGDSKLG